MLLHLAIRERVARWNVGGISQISSPAFRIARIQRQNIGADQTQLKGLKMLSRTASRTNCWGKMLFPMNYRTPDLFRHLLMCFHKLAAELVHSQNREMVTLLRKDPNKGSFMHNLRSITLLIAELEILVMVLVKWLARIVGGVVGEAQTCVIPSRFIHDNIHFICYTLENDLWKG